MNRLKEKTIATLLIAIFMISAFTIVMPVSADSPSIDGVIGTTEWDEAISYSLDPYTVHVNNDDLNMYVAFDYPVTVIGEWTQIDIYKEGAFTPNTLNHLWAWQAGPTHGAVWLPVEDGDDNGLFTQDEFSLSWSNIAPDRFEFVVATATEISIPLTELNLVPGDHIKIGFLLKIGDTLFDYPIDYGTWDIPNHPQSLFYQDPDNYADYTLWAPEPHVNTVESSTMHFEGALTFDENWFLVGTIPLTTDGFYAPDGGFDIYAKEGAMAYGDWAVETAQIIGHDAYYAGSPLGDATPDIPWHTPTECQLELTPDKWYLRFEPVLDIAPMSGTLTWRGDGTGYAEETGLSLNLREGIDLVAHGGGPQTWDQDVFYDPWSYAEVIPLEYPGFEVAVALKGDGICHVTLTPAPVPEPQLFDLTLNIVGEGTVVVAEMPPVPDQFEYYEGPSTDILPFATGTVVTLTAIPSANYEFDGWTGDGSLWNPPNIWQVTLDADKTATVTFEITEPEPVPEYTLTVDTIGTGIVILENGDPYDVPITVSEGTIVKLWALPDHIMNDWVFGSWSGPDGDDMELLPNPAWPGSGEEYLTENFGQITMDADKSVTAVFKQLFDLTLNIEGSGSVKWNVIPQPDPAIGGTFTESTNTETFPDGTVIRLVADPDLGWSFDGWTGEYDPFILIGADVTLDADKTATATFIPTPQSPPELSNLVITPSELWLGDGVAINFDITSTDSRPFTYTVIIDIKGDGHLIDVSLEGYGSEEVSYSIVPTATGIHSVTVDELTGSFMVLESPVLTLSPETGFATTITGEEFSVGTTVIIYWDSKTMVTVPFKITVELDGTFVAIVTALDSTYGTHKISANDGVSPIAEAFFTVPDMTGQTGPQGDDGAVGPQGEQGEAGDTGPTGLQGDLGPIGPQGEEGPQGEQGDLGPQGIQGETGDTGPAGADGAQGIPGEQGVPGPQGTQGETGATGLPGLDGTDGLLGEPGTDGADGVDGATGATGATGPKGSTGPRGATGSRGSTGATGSQGIQGKTGEQGPQGNVTGLLGPQGIQGLQGVAGEDGPQGLIGDAGPQGLQGEQGETGEQGLKGATGPQGEPAPVAVSYGGIVIGGVSLLGLIALFMKIKP